VILNQIENELQETDHSSTNTLVIYMEQIEAAFREAGVTVCSIQSTDLNKPDCDRSLFPATRRASVVNLGVLTTKMLGVL
jgi:hypothetical protein